MDHIIPRHIAIIPDGNRRWAVSHKKKTFLGHVEGAKTTEKILKIAFDAGVSYFTIWGASEDNLTKRSPQEIKALVNVFLKTLTKLSHSKQLKKYNVRVVVRGRFKELLKNKALNAIADALESETKKNSDKTLTILLGYDGRREMIDAIKKIKAEGKIVDENSVHESLWTNSLPPVDLVIRTGGEPHWSAGFMMWLVANSELYFTKTFWPAFSEKDLLRALREFSKRRRMMGA